MPDVVLALCQVKNNICEIVIYHQDAPDLYVEDIGRVSRLHDCTAAYNYVTIMSQIVQLY